MSKRSLTLDEAKELRRQLRHWIDKDFTPENLVMLSKEEPYTGMQIGRCVEPNSEMNVPEGEQLLFNYRLMFSVGSPAAGGFKEPDDGDDE